MRRGAENLQSALQQAKEPALIFHYAGVPKDYFSIL
jgi:hypothetical protein